MLQDVLSHIELRHFGEMSTEGGGGAEGGAGAEEKRKEVSPSLRGRRNDGEGSPAEPGREAKGATEAQIGALGHQKREEKTTRAGEEKTNGEVGEGFEVGGGKGKGASGRELGVGRIKGAAERG